MLSFIKYEIKKFDRLLHLVGFSFWMKTYLFETCRGKDKAIPLQAWTDPEGSRRLRLPAFKTIGT
jgi:hypothetical protein